MNQYPLEKDKGREQADAITTLLAQVPGMPERVPSSTQWIECGQKKPDPHGIF